MSAMDTLAAEKAAIPNADAESAADCNPASEKTFLTSPVFHIPIKLIARAEPAGKPFAPVSHRVYA